MDIFLLISIFIWAVIGVGALVSKHNAWVGTGALLASFVYLAKVSHGNNDIMAFIAVFLLWLSLSLLSFAWTLRGIKAKEVESACSFMSLGYLPVFAVLFLKYGAIASVGILLWFGLWYGFREMCHQEKTRIVLMCFPVLLVAVIFRSFLAVSYGILLWWLYKDVEKLWSVRNKRMC
ncbi:hypothetical protein [Thermococcus sp. 21S7]|uniref:hypothetical protein n=1 Tax=Thermococcus sp. 21S7 TaxID=1638221 RepID=UPI00143AE92A|nr:hypothetical protein [Thermococcus sp. 21S7]NJE61901.1 hypothetical protein [Thermococcus sp. 21S7]